MAFLNGVFNFGGQQKPQGQQGQQGQGQQGQNQNQNQNQNRFPSQGTQGQQQQGQQQNPGNANGSAGPAGNQQQPGNSNMGNGNNNPANPMDPFTDLLFPKPQQGQQQPAEKKTLFGGTDPAKVAEQVGQLDFTRDLDPALMQKALSGDQQSFSQVMNGVAQGVFKQMLSLTQGMVEHGVNFGNEQFGSTLDSRLRDYDMNNQDVDIPALQHPAGKAMLTGIKKTIATNNPKLSAKEVHAQAVDFMKTFSTQVVGGDGNQQNGGNNNGQPKEKNWFESMGLDENGN